MLNLNKKLIASIAAVFGILLVASQSLVSPVNIIGAIEELGEAISSPVSIPVSTPDEIPSPTETPTATPAPSNSNDNNGSSNSNNSGSSNNGGSNNSGPSICSDSKPTSAPRLLFAIVTGKNEVTLKWLGATGPVTHYSVTYGLMSGKEQYGD